MKKILVKSLTALGALTASLFFSAATQELKELRIYLPVLIISAFGIFELERRYLA